jgi:hypothetical protein
VIGNGLGAESGLLVSKRDSQWTIEARVTAKGAELVSPSDLPDVGFVPGGGGGGDPHPPINQSTLSSISSSTIAAAASSVIAPLSTSPTSLDTPSPTAVSDRRRRPYVYRPVGPTLVGVSPSPPPSLIPSLVHSSLASSPLSVSSPRDASPSPLSLPRRLEDGSHLNRSLRNGASSRAPLDIITKLREIPDVLSNSTSPKIPVSPATLLRPSSSSSSLAQQTTASSFGNDPAAPAGEVKGNPLFEVNSMIFDANMNASSSTHSGERTKLLAAVPPAMTGLWMQLPLQLFNFVLHTGKSPIVADACTDRQIANG